MDDVVIFVLGCVVSSATLAGIVYTAIEMRKFPLPDDPPPDE